MKFKEEMNNIQDEIIKLNQQEKTIKKRIKYLEEEKERKLQNFINEEGE